MLKRQSRRSKNTTSEIDKEIETWQQTERGMKTQICKKKLELLNEEDAVKVVQEFEDIKNKKSDIICLV